MEHFEKKCDCGTGCCGKGKKGAVLIVGMLLLAGVITIAILRDRIVNWPQYQISVTGQGKVAYESDIANITLGVQVDKAAKAEDALKQLNEKMGKITAALKNLGIATEDIKNQNYSLMPQYDYTNNITTTTGFSANQQLTIKVKDIKDNFNKVNKVVEEASKAGANQIVGIVFDVANLENLKQQARVMAIKDAKGKVGNLASAAGVEVGEVVGWWENVIQSPSVYNNPYYGGMGGGAMSSSVGSPVIPNGTQEIIIEMNLNYRIK